MKDMQSMSSLLARRGVKRATLRYSGREGRGLISEVNYLSEEGGFFKYDELKNLRLPENEICALGEEMLLHVKRDWADDWGGQGEIRWEPGKAIKIKHDDRFEKMDSFVLSVERIESKALIEQAGVPPTEFEQISEVVAHFDYEDGAPIFFGFEARQGEEVLGLSSVLTAAFNSAFAEAIAQLRKDQMSDDLILREGKCCFDKSQGIDVYMSCSREYYERLSFEIDPKVPILLPGEELEEDPESESEQE